ncbi:putative DNA replication licensing factor MCM5 [Toxoplasma gondii TgCatPRC2]|uniref:DNA helicase n=16 Tax=Toxoplasma gondii TaxID=5811 RepID=B9PP25_TOXGV|nr:DNA replication licensing factor MCM5, putative [Toxoplasma gondii ME49]EPR56660.1 putative DNA replication licensing factor MCM5 [Toxoplasma gondii GT1]ESS31651.1 putative DNA replication licensing factor MCM5 [Toxoplasma gondii VEG]KAF4643191.1 putative DNA replication licensing factor MCM5 [Toxoplasma gondii]KFG33158.1 putative DNA replication licensing factor MCM5 [Toxoplasma gondii GAB2-2007-GAL-DOM2]KFG34319.1 putative DNA replication licensing factor MCM5 [Toxoplasma gondii p89]KFG5|eukprot:XP_002366881.1 DNA replication licensing factor MCM5, putative [Toxoplasma gondii ME49]
MEETPVYFNTSRLEEGGFSSSSPSALMLPSSLPSVQQMKFNFRQYLNHGGAELKRRLLAHAEKNERCLLHVDLNDLKVYQHHVSEADLKCVDTPYCKKKHHAAPPDFARQLVTGLRQRPLVYLPTCERVCEEVIEKSAILPPRQLAASLALGGTAGRHGRRGPVQVQINLMDTSATHTPIRHLLSRQQEQFVVTTGIIISSRPPASRLQTVTIQCRYCNHKMIISLPEWREQLQLPRFCLYSQQRAAVASTAGPASVLGGDAGDLADLGCRNKPDPYFMVTNECSFVDVQSLKLQELPEDVPTGDMPRHLLLNCTRLLTDQAFPGDRLIIHGVLTTNVATPAVRHTGSKETDQPHSSYLHVLGLQKVSFMSLARTRLSFTQTEQRDVFYKLAQSQNILDKIAKSLAPALYGMEEVKRACACLLFGGTQKVVADGSRLRGDINVLLLGDPGVAKSQILKFVDKIAPISVYTSGKGSSAAGLTAAVLRDRTGVFTLEGGCMCLADGGVVCVDEFDKMDERDVVAMHEAMEQQTISISKAGINTVLNSRCAVLAAANPSFGSFDDTQDSSEQHEFKATILSRFDLIFLLRDKENYETDSALCTHILNLHAQKNVQRGNDDEEIIPFELLKNYIQFAKSLPPPLLGADARDALKNFYVQTRQDVRDDKRSKTRKIPITLRQLESLVRISESFAKMELSPVASSKHVQMAIELFSVSTAETARHSLVFEGLSPAEQKLIKQAEEAVLGRLQKGQRAQRKNLLRDLQMQGFDKNVLNRAVAILVRRGDLQERGDRSLRRP